MGRLRKKCDSSSSDPPDSSELETVPFKVGEEAEVRSFTSGYRGAWFRCTIYEIKLKKQECVCLCQYLDFFNAIWHKAYEPGNIPRKRLMLRPKYPKIVDSLTGQSAEESTMVVNRGWEVGDFAEWFWEGAYWECQILEILNDHQVMVRVPAVPFGEGGIYEVMKEVLRPALSWSPIFGWRCKKRDAFASPHVTVYDVPRNILVETAETKALYERIRSLLELVKNNDDSWPFTEPVDGKLVPDYYDVIKDPIDLKTISMRVNSKLYLTLERFVADLRRMFTNARSFNPPNTVYVKCADRLEECILRQLK